MADRPTSMHAAAVIAVTDLEAARAFYEGKLGLDGAPTPGGWAVSADHGTRLNLLSGVPSAGSADWPIATFEVQDVRSAVRELRDRDVPFLESDDLPFALDNDGVSSEQNGMLVAWIRDPDGNIITIYSLT